MTLACAALATTSALAMGSVATAAEAPHARAVCASPGKIADPSALGKASVTTFFRLLKREDVAGLRTFLAPDFQLVRPNGINDDKRSYLKKDLPDIEKFALRKFVTRVSGSTMTVSYQAKVAGTSAGGIYTDNYAPRLSSFSYCSGTWQLTSHANFNPLDG